MLRRLRHQLWLIDYYSANRRTSRLARARDAALFATFLLAIVTTVLADRLIENAIATTVQTGGMLETANGTVIVLADDENGRVPWVFGRGIAEVTLRAQERQFGWPLRTTRTEPELRVDLRPFDASVDPENVPTSDDEHVIRLIHDAIDDTGLPEIRAAHARTDPDASLHLSGWMLNIAIWWVGLYVVALIGILSYHVTVGTIRRRLLRRKIARAAEGCCIHCGYDMRGLEFNERCPECGGVVY